MKNTLTMRINVHNRETYIDFHGKQIHTNTHRRQRQKKTREKYM